ncbi:unnamed protein product [Paramecium sonneborni]|uniref:Transmembrane protein n=1 Tax=Paramecium sonneborni TaxID=65129 RepID=A0A8S1QWI9_9CILI|nr:unnamed protein product [Paramecium sonneborni]
MNRLKINKFRLWKYWNWILQDQKDGRKIQRMLINSIIVNIQNQNQYKNFQEFFLRMQQQQIKIERMKFLFERYFYKFVHSFPIVCNISMISSIATSLSF